MVEERVSSWDVERQASSWVVEEHDSSWVVERQASSSWEAEGQAAFGPAKG